MKSKQKLYFSSADVIFEDDEPYVGSRCKIPVQIDGICLPTVECPEAIQELKKHKTQPNICFFIRSEPIVCCPTQHRVVKSGTIRKSVESKLKFLINENKKK